MEDRQNELSNLRLYIEKTDKELTMILQTLQWDRKQLLKNEEFTQCPHDKDHVIPVSAKYEHDKKCFLSTNGYTAHDKLLPDPGSSTVIKFSKEDLSRIFQTAAQNDAQFKRGIGHTEDVLPLTLERIQSTYTTDERRAIHDAVVAAAPTHEDHLTDLTLPGASRKEGRTKSHLELLAELRDMKRRRAKYRVAAKTNNYSDVLRDVIKTQMEMCTEVKTEKIINESNTNNTNYQEKSYRDTREHQPDRRRDSEKRRYEKHHNSETRDNRNKDSRENRDKRNKEEFRIKVEKDDDNSSGRRNRDSYRHNRSSTSSSSYRDSSYYNTIQIKEEPRSPSSMSHYDNSHYKRDNDKRSDKASSTYKREDRKRSKDRKYYEHDSRFEEKRRSRR